MPTATALPTPRPGAAVLAFETYRDGNGEIYLLDSLSGDLTNLTRNPADDRSPSWSPGGQAIAFESHRDGNWEIYTLDLLSGKLSRLTHDLGYDGSPTWSPDGSQIAFESYRDGNLEIYAMAANGGGQRRLTDNPAGDYGPAWSPDGSWIAFTSWRDGNKEVYALPAAGGAAVNLTRNPADDEDPAWAPDGSALAFTSWRDVDPATGNRNAEIYRLALSVGELQSAPAQTPEGNAERLTVNPWPDLDPSWDVQGRLVWSVYDPGPSFETYDPYRPGDLHLYRSSDAAPQRLTTSNADDRRPAPAPAEATMVISTTSWLPSLPPTAAPLPTLAAGALAQVVEVPTILAATDGPPILVNELVMPSLLAWQQDVRAATGWDLLHVTHGSWRAIEHYKRERFAYAYGFLSWHKTGRALDGPFEYVVNGKDQMLVSREDLGEFVFWRTFLRTAAQDGTQGEPLKANPWLFWWRIVQDAEPEAYAAGGKRLPIPAGYYVDVTALAKRHGWVRIASYAIEGDYDWHTSSNGTEYWHYERTDALSWWDAMRQIYDTQTLEERVGWQAGLDHAQSAAMMRTKGVPTPAP